VELLLNARADVNHANAEMKTVLDCASFLHEDSRGLLLEHGAKTFADAAPELERNANAHLSQILATGFGSERQAFVGGDAGTKLTPAAQRSLQVVATAVLKLYPWAPCRISIQTDSGRHQAQLAGERVQSVKATLESAGCKNTFDTHYGSQRTLVGISLSLLPPTSPAPRAVKSSLLPATRQTPPRATVANMPPSNSPSRDVPRDRRTPGASQPTSPVLQRSPSAVLGQHGSFGRLAHMAHGEAMPSTQGARAPAGSLGTVGAALMGSASGATRPQAAGVSPSGQAAFVDSRYHPLTGTSAASSSSSSCPKRQAWSQAAPGAAGAGPPVGQAGGGLVGAAAAFAGFDGGTAHSPQGARPGAVGTSPAAQRTPTRNSGDLSALVGERWSRTNITCSLSSPALPQMPPAGWPRGSPVASRQPPQMPFAQGGGTERDWAPQRSRANNGNIPASLGRPTSGRPQATPKAVHGGSWLRSDSGQLSKSPSAEASPPVSQHRSLPARNGSAQPHRAGSHQVVGPGTASSHPQVFSVSDLMG